MAHRTVRLLISLVLLGCVAPALAGPCDAYYRFDGNLNDSSGNGYQGQMIAKGGVPSTPKFVAGRDGEALKLNGANAMRAPLDLHPDNCPQMTVAAWVRVEPQPNQMIFGNANSNRLFTSDTAIGIRTSGKDLWADGKPVRANGGWFFVAGVWDYNNQYHRLHWRTRSKEESLVGHEPKIPESAIWIGADNDKLHYAAKDLAIDEIMFIGRALSKDEVLALRREGLTGLVTDNQAPAETEAESTPGRVEQSVDALERSVGTNGATESNDVASTGSTTGDSTNRTATGNTLSQMQTQASARSADAVGSVDRQSPSDILPDSSADESHTLSEMQAQSATRNADIVGDVDRQSPADVLPPSGSGGAASPRESDGSAGDERGELRGPLAGQNVGGFLGTASPLERPSGDVALCKPFDQGIPLLAMGFRDELLEVAARQGCRFLAKAIWETNTGAGVQDSIEYRTATFQSDLLKETYQTCIGGGPPSSSIPSGVASFWNAQVANNGWGTIGPRQLTFNERAEGNLVAPGDRKFITLLPWLNEDQPAILELEEMSGRARVYGTVCSVDPWTNHYDVVHSFSLNDTEEEKNTLQAIVQTLSSDFKFYSVDLDARGIPTRHFKYKIRIGR